MSTVHHTPAAFVQALADRSFSVAAEEVGEWRRFVTPGAYGKPKMAVHLTGPDDAHSMRITAYEHGNYGTAWDVRFPGNTPMSVVLATIDAGIAAYGA